MYAASSASNIAVQVARHQILVQQHIFKHRAFLELLLPVDVKMGCPPLLSAGCRVTLSRAVLQIRADFIRGGKSGVGGLNIRQSEVGVNCRGPHDSEAGHFP